VAALLNNLDARIKSGTKKFILLISSQGGSVFAGISAYHYLKGIPAEVVTHNFGSADSIASLIFCAGSQRLSVPEGRFLLHGISVTFSGNTSLEQGLIEERLKMIQQESQSIAAVISETVGKPKSEVLDVISRRTVMTAEEAKKWGLVTEIKASLYDAGAEVVTIGSLTDTAKPIAARAEAVTSNSNVFESKPDFAFSKLEEYLSQIIAAASQQ
jgi:ATP-dependent Clp protease protease subunit